VFGFCALILIGVKGCSDAMNAADLKKLDADIAKTDAENQSAAVTMGVTVADYMAAKADSDRAYAACKVAAEGRAKHDYKADFFPNSTWAVKNRVISLVGRDLQMQNGFGVYGRVSYFCDWSMDAQMVTSLHLSED
jgi:outer membrane cobalamin receptor